MATSSKRVCVSLAVVEGRQRTDTTGDRTVPVLDARSRTASKRLADYFAMASVDVPAGASSAVLKPSDPVSEDAVSVQGPNFDNPLDLQQFISSYERIGFQANSLGKAIHIVNNMVCTLQYISVVLKTFSAR